nr:universal stress protein [Deinococcus deserti]
MIPRVLIPVETLDMASPALTTARRFFPTAPCHLLHVLPAAPQTVSSLGGPVIMIGTGEPAHREAEQQLSALGNGEVVSGSDPASEIVRRTFTQEFDLVVMGTSGRRGLARALLGSIAERVVRESALPVITVRHGEPEPTSRILVMTDFSSAANRAYGAVQQYFPGAEVHLMHVVSPTALTAPVSLPPAGRAITASSLIARNREWIQEAREQLATLGGGEIVEGDPAEVALERARSGMYGLIALGTAGRGGVERLMFGSVAQRIVRESPVPVLTARALDPDSSMNGPSSFRLNDNGGSLGA